MCGQRAMLQHFNGVFKGKTVLVTGHTGFKGSWLCAWLLMLGAEVVGYALGPPGRPNLFQAAGLERRVKHISGDVTDGGHLKEVVRTYRPEIVFHLAAQSLVRASYLEPALTYGTNVMGTVNVLEALRGTDWAWVCIVVTSDKCYENEEWLYGYRENDKLGGHDPYSSSKACAELVVGAYRDSFFTGEGQNRLSLSSVRAGNVIGGGDWATDRLVPDAMRALAEGRPVVVRNPHSVRPWQHVLDPLSGYLWLAALMWENGTGYNAAWNFGPESESLCTVAVLVDKILDCWGGGLRQVPAQVSTDLRLHEAGYLKLDSSKARGVLGWKPVYGLDQAVEQTVAWYRTYAAGPADLLGMTIGQIDGFAEKAARNQAVWTLPKGR